MIKVNDTDSRTTLLKTSFKKVTLISENDLMFALYKYSLFYFPFGFQCSFQWAVVYSEHMLFTGVFMRALANI